MDGFVDRCKAVCPLWVDVIGVQIKSFYPPSLMQSTIGFFIGFFKRFFAPLKKQAIYGERFLTREAAKQQIFEYIECDYNRVRRHSTNGWVSPVDFEAAYYKSIEGMHV